MKIPEWFNCLKRYREEMAIFEIIKKEIFVFRNKFLF